MGRKLKELIEAHQAFYEMNEKKEFDKAKRYYRGDFTKLGDPKRDSTQEELYYIATKNIVFAIADTAVSALLGNNPKVSATARNPLSEKGAPIATGVMEWVFDHNKMRRRSRTNLIDGVLLGRAIFKTGWDAERDAPKIRVVDPSSVFFDLSVREPDEIKYWLESTVITEEEFNKRVEGGIYEASEIKKIHDIKPEVYPKWMIDEQQKVAHAEKIRAATKWIVVWEYYDSEENIVVHYHKGTDQILLKEELKYIPYSLFEMNPNGVDCRGLSEVQLTLPQQDTMNDLLTHWKHIAYLMIPRIFYNSGLVNEEDLNNAISAATGAFIPLKMNGDAGGPPVDDVKKCFFDVPRPDFPKEIAEFLERTEDDAAFVSALMELSRGQFAGAKTATEVAVMDAQNRTRVTTREGNLSDVLEDVAGKAFWLCQQYMKTTKYVRIVGEKGLHPAELDNICDLDVDFKLTAYNPIKNNPAVLLETIIQMLPYLRESGNWDMHSVDSYIRELAGFPIDTLLSREKLDEIQKKAAMEAAAQQMATAQPPVTPQLPPGGESQPELSQETAPEIPQEVLRAAQMAPSEQII